MFNCEHRRFISAVFWIFVLLFMFFCNYIYVIVINVKRGDEIRVWINKNLKAISEQ